MTKENKKNEGISCACGKADLYEEWLKNEKDKKEASETKDSPIAEDKKTLQKQNIIQINEMCLQIRYKKQVLNPPGNI